jgi:hypothetical protein
MKGVVMKNLSAVIFILSINLSAQTYLNRNWVLFNKDNSPLLSNSINAFFEDDNNGYWISSVGENNRGYLQFFKDGIWQKFDSTNSPLKTSTVITDISQARDGKMLFGTAANGIYILDNGNWDSLNTSNSLIPDNYVFKITVDLINRYWIGIPNYGIDAYNNGSWTFFHDQNSFQGIGDFNFIEVDSSNKIWVGTDFFGLYYYDGNSWIKAISGQFSGGPSQVFTSLSVDSENRKWVTINLQGGGSKIAASLTDTSFVYYDSTNWVFQFTLFSYKGVVIDKNNIKYFGTTNGLLIYNDGNWQFINSSNSPVPSNWFTEGLSDSRNNKIYILSSFQPYQNYGLIFYNQDSVIVTSAEHNSLTINNFYLFQNYPNPFNPITKIKFSVPNSEIVQIKVFDILGKEIKTLLNEYKQAGTYEVEFSTGSFGDATSLPSGVYFYRIISGNYSETKKMILLR